MTPNTESLITNKSKPSFWLLHSIGWTTYVIIMTFDNLFLIPSDIGSAVILPLVISAIYAALLTLPLRYFYRSCWHLSPLKLIVLIACSSMIVAALWTPAKNIAVWQLSSGHDVLAWIEGRGEAAFSALNLFMSLSYAFFMVFVWSTLYFAINYHYRLINEQQLHINAVRLSHNAQIKMLRYQINPHFLFNTLNAISTLVLQGNQQKANGMLTRLSTFLRFSLDNDPEKKIQLLEEIKALMLYLEIEKTRFDDRLSIDISVEQDAENLMVPSLLLQPLIENSIKYAIAQMTSGGIIEIIAKREQGYLHLVIADNGPGMTENPVEQSNNSAQHIGVGVNNIKERLHVLYPNNHRFIIGKNTPVGHKVTIIIPMELS